MKVIDLLNKIANGEDVPKRIKFCFRTFEYNDMGDYLCIEKNDYSKEDYCNGYSIHKWIFGNNLTDEVEIIEEDKKIEKLDIINTIIGIFDKRCIEEYFRVVFSQQKEEAIKINELINEINKLKENK